MFAVETGTHPMLREGNLAYGFTLDLEDPFDCWASKLQKGIVPGLAVGIDGPDGSYTPECISFSMLSDHPDPLERYRISTHKGVQIGLGQFLEAREVPVTIICDLEKVIALHGERLVAVGSAFNPETPHSTLRFGIDSYQRRVRGVRIEPGDPEITHPDEVVVRPSQPGEYQRLAIPQSTWVGAVIFKSDLQSIQNLGRNAPLEKPIPLIDPRGNELGYYGR